MLKKCPVCKKKDVAKTIFDGWFCRACSSHGKRGWNGGVVQVDHNSLKAKE